MKFTIITPSYNQGEYISKCFESVKSHCGIDIEHIILDNCSDDETHQHIISYQKNPGTTFIRCIIEQDKGQTYAINKGLNLAMGDIVCWLNTDEFYYDGALSLVAKFFSENPDIDVVFGDSTFVDKDDKIIKEKKEYGFDKNMLIYYGCYIPSCATFVRRRVIDQGYMLDESFSVCMDFDWYVRIANAGFKFAHIPVKLAQFTWHDTNVSSRLKKKRIEEHCSVQLRCGGGIGSDGFKKTCFHIIHYYYIAKRVFVRTLFAIYPGFYRKINKVGNDDGHVKS